MKNILLYLLLLVLSACTQVEEDWRATGFTLPTVIFVEADNQAVTRTPGDPGADPSLPLPRYLYLFIASPEGNIYYNHQTLDKEDWSFVGAVSNTAAIYKRSFQLILPNYLGSETEGRVFAICSYQSLPQFSAANGYQDRTVLSHSLDEIKSLQFDRELSANASISLRDVYGGCDKIDNYNTRPSANVICTHIATKLDVRWSLRNILNDYPNAKVHNFYIHDVPRYGYYFNDVLSDHSEVGHAKNLPTIACMLKIAENGNISPGSSVYGRHDLYSFHPSDNRVTWSIDINNGVTTNNETRNYKQSLVMNHNENSAAYFRLDVNIDGFNGTVVTP